MIEPPENYLLHVALRALIYKELVWWTDYHHTLEIDGHGVRPDDLPVSFALNYTAIAFTEDADMDALTAIEAVNDAYRLSPQDGRKALRAMLRAADVSEPERTDAVLHAIDHAPPPDLRPEWFDDVAVRMTHLRAVGVLRTFGDLTPGAVAFLRRRGVRLAGVRPAA